MTRQVVNEAFRQELPVRFHGYSTHFGKPNPHDHGVRVSEEIENEPVEHLIMIETISGYWQKERDDRSAARADGTRVVE